MQKKRVPTSQPEKTPILTLTAKDWLSGISGSDFAGYGGVLKVANGVSAVRNLGSTSEANIGLLQAGPSGQNGGSAVVDNPLVSATTHIDATHAYMYVFGSSGHIYQKDALGGAPTDLGASSQITNFANGCAVYKPKSASTKYLYYAQAQKIGRVSVNSAPSSYPTGWTDNWAGSGGTIDVVIQNTTIHPMHPFNNAVYFADDYRIGSISDDGVSDATATVGALEFPKHLRVNCLEDDGVYLVAALSADKQTTGGKISNKIVFWDTIKPTSWEREYPIQDEISFMKRIGGVIYALGSRGIYTVSFAKGVQKVWQIGSAVSVGNYGTQMLSSFNDALVVGIASSTSGAAGQVAIFGKPHPLLPSAYHTPFTIDSGSGVSFVDAEFIDGVLLIGDSSTALKEYNWGADASHQRTGVNAQTVNFSLPGPFQIERVDIVFGRVLASGDSVTVKVRQNDGSTDSTFGINGGAITYAALGAVRRVQAYPSGLRPIVEDLKLTLTFNGGAAAIRKVEVYGKAVSARTL